MASKPHQPLGDVSCRATGYTIQQLRRMGLPTAHLTRGLAHTLDDLQSHSASIPWDDYLVFLHNSHTDLPTHQLVELCTSYKSSPYLRPLLSAAGLWFHPSRCFQWVADPESGAIQQLFRCVKTRFTRIDEREVVIEEVVAPGLALPPDIFWETQSIAFGALTTHFGMGFSIVTWEPIERGAAFRVRLPRRRPIRFVLSWLASWFRRDTADDIRSALSFGHERSLRLEREIAERKIAEADRRDSEERFRRITDAVPGIVYQYYLDPDGNQGFIFVSGGATAQTGYTPEELIARPGLLWERIHQDDIPGVRDSILESARNGAPWQYEFRFRTKAGDSRWVRGRSIPEPMTNPGRVVWNGILSDVTAEREADAQLRSRDALLRKLSEQVPGFIYQYQQWPDGRSCFPYASEGIRHIYEVAPEDVRGSAEMVFGRLHPEDFDTVAQSIGRSLESLEPWRCEYRVRLPGRGTQWLDGHAVPERMPDGSTIWHGYIRDVTDRKQAEETIRESENRFRTLIEDLQVGVVLIAPDDRMMLSNPAACRILGLTHDQLHGVAARDPRWEIVREDGTLFSPEDIPFSVIARTRQPLLNVTVGSRNQDTGHRAWMQVNGTPRLNPDGTLLHVILTFVDITELKRAERLVRESEARFRAFMEFSPVLAWIVSPDGRFLFSNHGFSRLLKMTPDAVERSTIRDVFPPNYAAEYLANNRKVLESAVPIETIEHATRMDGSEGEFLAYKFPLPDGAGLVGGVAVDITERKRAEEALAESRDAAERALADLRVASARAEQFYRLCEVAGQGIGIARLDGVLTYMNPAFRRILEIPDGDDLTRRAFWELVPSENHPHLAETVLSQTRETGSWSGEFDLLTLTGKRVPIINTVVLLRDPDGTVVGYSNIATDISEQKRAEAAVRESEERFRAYIDNAPTGLFVLDENGRYVDVNPAASRLSGYDREELLGMGVGDLTTPEAKSESRPTFDRMNLDGVIEVDWLLRRKSGELRQISIAAVRLSGDRSMGFITDITDRKRAEEALRARKDLYMMLARTNRAVSQSGSADELYRELCEIAVTTGGFLFAWVGVPDGDQLKVAARAGNDNGYLDEIVISLDSADPRSRGPAGRVIASGLPVVTNDFLASASTGPWHKSALRIGVAASAGFPLMQNGVVVAVFSMYAQARDFFTPELVETLGEITPSVSFALDGFSREAERRAAQEALHASELRYRTLFDTAPYAVVVTDLAERYVAFNHAFLTQSGLSAEEVAGRTAVELGLLEPDPTDREIMRELLSIGRVDNKVRRGARLTEGERVTQYSARVFDFGGQPHILSCTVDITKLATTEAALRESEERWKFALEGAQAGVIDWDIASDRINFSERWRDLTGYQPGDIAETGEGLKGLVHSDDLPVALHDLEATLAGRQTLHKVDHRLRRADGRWIWIEARSIVTSRGPDGAPLRMIGSHTDITDRKRGENLLRFQNALLQSQTEASPDGILVVDPANNILSYNHRFLDVWGIPKELVAAGDDTKVLARARTLAADPLAFGARVAAIYADPDTPSHDEVALADGRTLDRYSRPIRGSDGELLGLVWYFRDITDRKRAVRALEEAERRQRLALDSGRMGTWDWDIEHGRVNWDARQQELFGFAPGEYDGHPDTFFSRVHPDDVKMLRQRIDESVKMGVDYEAEFRIFPRSDDLRWVAGRGRVILDENCRPIRMVGVNFDLTDRKRAVLALQESERRHLLALDSGRMGTWDWEIGSDRLTWDDREQKLFGFRPGEFDGRVGTFLAQVHPDDLTGVQEVLAAAAAGKDFDGEFRIRSASGAVRWIHGSGVVVPKGDHHPPRLVGINYDITERKAAEAALRESEERLRIFVENAPAGVAMLDRDLRYISYSQRWLTDYGLLDQKLVGRTHYEVFPEVTDRWKEIHNRCLTGASERCEQDRFERADGTVDYLRWEIQPWRDSTGAVGGLVFFTELITDRVKAEEQIRASLREKEAMLKEIHHRVKNNLQVISSLLSLQAARVTHPAATDVLAESQNRVRAMALVHETLYRSEDFARVDLARYLGELSGYLFRSYGVDSARIRLVLDVEPVTVSLDKTIPCGLLVNEIVSNSLKYAFPGTRSGNVTIRARKQPDGNLNLTLADDGVGLPVDVVVDRTPSLGLQLVNILTEQLGGQLNVERSHGTRFSITFSPSQSQGA